MIHSPLTAVRCFDNGYVGKQPLAWKEYCAEYWLIELQESMDMCTDHSGITGTLLKMPLNTIDPYIHPTGYQSSRNQFVLELVRPLACSSRLVRHILFFFTSNF